MASSGQKRNCVNCGKDIPFDAQMCPYCGYNFQAAQMMAGTKVSPGVRILLALVSFLFFFVGLIIGVIYLTREDEEYKAVGKMCIIYAIFGLIFTILCYVFYWSVYWWSIW